MCGWRWRRREHVHAEIARRWWDEETGRVAFTRFTQIGLLCLLTTPAAMDGKPLSMMEAWRVHDEFYQDDRVVFLPESREVEATFRRRTAGHASSPRLWADAWLLAVADVAGGVVVTFHGALASRGARSLLS